MAYLSLYRKHRPQTFEEILGQEHVSTTLANAIVEDRVSHAYLFTGPRGTGKTSTARILAKALNCEKGPTPRPCGVCESCLAIADGSSLDVIEMDAASHSKVDETREILAGVPLATAGARRKVYVIDEVHMLSTAAFNALLKTLEEPPPHVVFVLATTEAHKVLPTIVSRTQRFDFRRVATGILEGHLAQIAKAEEIDANAEAIAAVARHAEGSVRDALSILDQLASLGGAVTEDDVLRVLGHRTEQALEDIFDAVLAEDVAGVFQVVHKLVAQGVDVRQLTLDAIEHVRSLLLLKTTPDAAELIDAGDDTASLLQQSEKFTPGALLRTLDLLSGALAEMRNTPEHRLLFEIALVRSAAPETDPSANGLLGRIERLERRLGIEGEEAGGAQSAQVPPKSAQVPPKSAQVPPEPKPDLREPSSRSGAPGPRAAEEPPTQKGAPSQEAPAGIPAQIGLGHIKEAWPATLKEVSKRSKRVWGLLSPSRPVDFDGSTATIEVQSEFHMSSMSEARNMEVLQSSIHAALGISPTLQFVTRLSPAQPRPAAEDEVVDEPTGDAPADPVELVKEGLGAEVIETKSASSEGKSS